MSHDGPDLFTPLTAPYAPGSASSYEAAKAIEPAAETLRRAVLDWFRLQGDSGGTDEEGQDATGIPGSTWRPRRGELCAKGLLFDSGQQRRTRAGRKATVWKAM